ncbi:MAG TPA: DUF4340 domain-containing protein [Acidobacteriota bacterium]|nr:DUF4340 domain-containing protein [Acidobacteriota bacterium]
MSERNLIILAVTASILIILTALLYSGLDFSRESFKSGTPLLQGLDPEKIGSIKIKKGEDEVTLKRSEEGFVIEEKNGYPADTVKINNLLIDLLETRLAEKITDSAANHGELGVAEGSEDAITIILSDLEGKQIAGIIKGKQVSRGAGSHVRLIAENAVYSTEKTFTIDTNATDYMNDELFEDLETEKIARVDVITSLGGYTLVRKPADGEDEEGKIILLDIPNGKTADEEACGSVFEALDYLSFDDVRRADELQLVWDGTYVCTFESGLSYTIQSAKSGDKYYISLSARPPAVGQVTISPDEAEDSLKEKEALLLAGDAAEAFNQRHNGWIYEISESDSEDLRKPVEELFEQEEGEEAET